MRFTLVVAFSRVEEIVPLAKVADELGYHSLSIADHVVDLESIGTPYPYEDDGNRRWGHEAHWPDPWVMFGALGAVTTNLRFFTSIYVAAMRSPYQVAKSVGTASIVTGGRVALGVGVGWCREEFELMGQEFASRGSRTDEMLDLLPRLWAPGWAESDGPHYPTPRLSMEPSPTHRISILVGGLSAVALRRAARFDGWVGDIASTDDAIGVASRLARLREEAGRTGPFEVIAALNDAFTPEHFARAAQGGVTESMVAPWAYYHGMAASLEQKIESMHRFHHDVVSHF